MKFAETILAEYETERLKAKLFELPDLIRSAKLEVSQLKQEYKAAESDRQAAEAELLLAITTELGDNGKPKFSNVEARSAELIRRKATDEDYLIAEKVAREAEEKVNAAQFNLERLCDQFKSYRIVTDLTARELALMATDDVGEPAETTEPF